MISGSKNLSYFSRGVRTYGSKPVIAKSRGRWEFEFIFKGRARPTGVDRPFLEETMPRLYVFHPDSPHGWTDDVGEFSEIFVLQFKDVPEELVERVGPTKPILIELKESDRRRLYLRLNEIWDMLKGGGARASLQVQLLLIELAAFVVGQDNDIDPKTELADKISRAINWFEENLGENPSVENAASAVGVSTSHLRRLFAQAGKPSPQSELARLKLEAAQRCLLNGWTQEAVAQFLGFSETSAFARAFRDGCGQPPGAWLVQHQGTREN
ncbi:MAG: AraC family transcriptional regulator [Rariglobus sp.]|nr:AraC family transcriptional regulator [Rariglobus sp.]